jgi:class 3 adenylate cyclase
LKSRGYLLCFQEVGFEIPPKHYPLRDKKVRQLAAIMFTDIVGYTALTQGDEELAIKVRARHREVFKQQHKLHDANPLA